MNLSVIYPLHLNFQTQYLLERLQRCLLNTTEGLPDAEHLIVLSGAEKYKKKARNLLVQFGSTVTIIEYGNPTEPYSPGIARNFCVDYASKGYLLFWDIDLLGSQQLFSAIPEHLEDIKHSEQSFHMYPSFYLCKKYSNHFVNDFAQLFEDVKQHKTNTIEHVAMATSTILCSRKHFINIGKFSEDFIGHMGEDLELLNRLSIAYGRYGFEESHFDDQPSKIPSHLRGFRKHFARYSLEELQYMRFTCHLHHSTRLYSTYRKSKINNRKLLIEKISKVKPSNNAKATKVDWPCFLTMAPKIKRSYLEIRYRKTRKIIIKLVSGRRAL